MSRTGRSEEPGQLLRACAKSRWRVQPGMPYKAMAIYSRAVAKLVPVSSCRVAEAIKLLENIFRSVNIAMVNELKIVYARLGKHRYFERAKRCLAKLPLN